MLGEDPGGVVGPEPHVQVVVGRCGVQWIVAEHGAVERPPVQRRSVVVGGHVAIVVRLRVLDPDQAESAHTGADRDKPVCECYDDVLVLPAGLAGVVEVGAAGGVARSGPTAARPRRGLGGRRPRARRTPGRGAR